MRNYHTKAILITAQIYYWYKITLVNINNIYQ